MTLFWQKERQPAPAWAIAFNFLIGLVVLSGIFYYALDRSLATWNWGVLTDYRQMFLSGWKLTIFISAIALVLSVLLGFLAALAGRSPFLPLRCTAKIFVELIRGTPLLVQVLIFFYVIADAFHLENRLVVGIATLAIFEGAYISEIFRAGIESIGKSQLESARAIGLTPWQTYRHVIVPQAIRVTLPPLAGQFANIIKNSSLLSVVALVEFTKSASDAASLTYSNLECYLILAPGYLILTVPISLWTQWLERQHRYDT